MYDNINRNKTKKNHTHTTKNPLNCSIKILMFNGGYEWMKEKEKRNKQVTIEISSFF